MDDLISGQAAIDELGYCQTYLFDSRDKDKKISLEDAEYAIEQLPSAQPEWKKVGENPMISEEKMKIVINNYFKDECNVNMSIREAFEKGFRIGVKKGESLTKVIKCKNCKNFRKNITCVGGFYDGCTELLNEGNEIPVDENFYCGFAKRKTDGQIN